MSDDLVEIARGSHGEVWYKDETMKEPRLLIHVLADEIARLRAERDALQARVAKLKTALQFIKDAPEPDRKPNLNNMSSYEAGLRYCAAFARAALTGGKDE